MIKFYWYHITEKNWSNTILLKPKQFGNNWGSNESGPPRICVSPTIEQCFAAIPYSEYDSDYKVYRTQHKEIAENADKNVVDDTNITDEHWIFVPTVFIKVLTIPMLDMKSFPKLTSQNLTSQNQVKVIKYVKSYLVDKNIIGEISYKDFYI